MFVLFLALFQVAGYSHAQKVDVNGIKVSVKLEAPVSGYLTELNGKYKLRATEFIIEPGGYVGDHHHIGPGIRLVSSGELAFVQDGKTTIYKTGDYFYESGAESHSARNNTSVPVVLVNFELMPADWKRGTAIPPKAK